MKAFIIAIFSMLTINSHPKLEGSVWICKIADGCVDTLKFKSNGKVTDYSCEQEYTYHGSYSIYKDTLIITELDDSHSEDNGKSTLYRTKFWMGKKNVLSIISNGELVKGKWKYKLAKSGSRCFYRSRK